MEIKKEVYRTGLMIGVLTFLVNIISMPVETLILGLVSLVLNYCNRKLYRVKAGVVCTILGMALSVSYLLFVILTMKLGGASYEGYWLFELLNK